MKLGQALEHLQVSMADLGDELRKLADRHVAEHDVHAMSLLLAERADELTAGMALFTEAYGDGARTAETSEAWASLVGRLRELGGKATGSSPKAGALLLRDLHEVYLQAREGEIDWVIVRQGAMAARDPELIEAASRGMAETERIAKWLTTRIKESAPQVLIAAD